MAPRILLCGDVLGRFNALFKRVATVNKANGPFDALLCVGQFFPNDTVGLDEMMQYIEGHKEIPLPVYFIGDYGAGVASILSSAKLKSANEGFRMEGIPVCNNFYWLKGSGKFVLHGLSIAYLAGRSQSGGISVGSYHEDDIDALRALAEEPSIVDLFLTNEWPQGILSGANVADTLPEIKHVSGGNPVISELAAELKPRYHIAGSEGVFYAREPYSNDGALHVTRFLGLADVANEKKQKFIHALCPKPASEMSASEISSRPANTTASPYKVLPQSIEVKDTMKRSGDSDGQYWRYDVSQKRPRQDTADGERVCFQFLSTGSCLRGDKCNFRHDMDNKIPFSKGACFDFISRGKCDRGDKCRFSHDLDGGKKRENAVSNVDNELQKYKQALKRFFRKQGNATIVFERHLQQRMSGHGHLQVIPIPLSKASIVQSEFVSAAKDLGFKFEVIRPGENNIDIKQSLKKSLQGSTGYFFVELPEGTILAHSLEAGQKLPMQFGREVLASLLGIRDRIDWKDCTFSKEEEAAMTEDFKKRFETFDPTQST